MSYGPPIRVYPLGEHGQVYRSSNIEPLPKALVTEKDKAPANLLAEEEAKLAALNEPRLGRAGPFSPVHREHVDPLCHLGVDPAVR